MSLDDPEFQDAYDAFLEFADELGAEPAAAKLRRLRIDEAVLREVIERYEHHVGVIKEHGSPPVISGGNRLDWYTGPRPDDKYWHPILRTLEANDWGESNLSDLKQSSSKIVSLLDHPKTDTFSTKGLVVGYVQSGKTTNFTSVLAKAADRGYRLFIVLAGIHNELRRQTQERLTQDLVVPNPTYWHALTSAERDFEPPVSAAAAFLAKHTGQHVLCVVKKNKYPLEKLIAWLGQATDQLREVPALIIDDEADQAAVATKTINPLVRDLVGLLPKVAYVGYTATPFANVLIDPASDDLYPEDFIVDLPKPEGHVGTEVLFGREPLDGEDPEMAPTGEDMIRIVPDHEVPSVRPMSRADIPDFEPDLDGQLESAVRWFWMATAARRVRDGAARHSTMLLHTSVNTLVHESFRAPLESLRLRTLKALNDEVFQSELRAQWGAELKRVSAEDHGEAEVEFREMLDELPAVLSTSRVVLDNSTSLDRLDYRGDPVVAIAVGGNTLSRGLTLEGLVVSYFVRSVSAYDTLLQMGRWFGYRRGYGDLPRIWMTTELRDWFRHIATVEADLRQDIRRYMVEDVTPLDFAVRIRTHPALRVTSAAKMGSAVRAASSYGGQRIQTRYFKANDETWLVANQAAARALTARVASGGAGREIDPGRLLYEGVPASAVLEFLSAYRFHDLSVDCDRSLVMDYIAKRMAGGVLRQWNVALLGNPPNKGTSTFDFGSGVVIPTVVRSKLFGTDPGRADIKTLMSRRDAAVDLLDIPRGELTENKIKELRVDQLPDTGLLTIYPIDSYSSPERPPKNPAHPQREPLAADAAVIGVGMVFPLPTVGEDAAVEWDYVSADLSGISPGIGYLEEEDLSVLDEGAPA